jgi:DNA-binding MarR family transcriptional regulator
VADRARQIVPTRLLDRALDEALVGGLEKLVLIVMCRRGNRSGVCFMSVKRLAEEAGISVSSVKRSLKRLRAAGLVVAVDLATDGYLQIRKAMRTPRHRNSDSRAIEWYLS